MTIKLHITTIKVSRDGYDASGAYWGHVPGTSIYVAEAMRPDPGSSPRSWRPLTFTFRAADKKTARRQIRIAFPDCQFVE